MEENKPLLSVGVKDWIKTFWMFLFSTVLSIAGDAIIQALSTGSYSLSAIHWHEIGAAILVTVLTYLKKNLLTNSNGQVLIKE